MDFLFEKKYVDYLTVYKIPLGPDQLDPLVFYSPETGEEPKLLPAIHAQITKDLEMFTSGQPQRIEDYYIVGPGAEPGPKNRLKDIKVVIVLNKKLMDLDVDGLLAERLLKLANSLSGKYATGTGRKIVYSITMRPVKDSDYKAIYDIFRSQWVRKPSGLG